ncbi:hypothetical protein HCG51_10490 [Tolypothrix sp. PCC 7910]|nr:hypothetical protein [Tolypothrix sp. PCC 7910]QIR35274.1 hypothetical protein HCG51_10490 [Tolypothrix sp. PCC 7910]
MLLSISRLPTIENPHRKPYPSYLSDAEWLILSSTLSIVKNRTTAWS